MTVDYAAAKVDALAGIVEGGTDAVLIQRGASVGLAHNPTAGTDTEHQCKALLLSYGKTEIDGTLVQRQDRKLLVAAEGLTVAPVPVDKIRIGGVTFDIVSVMPFDPGGVAVYFEVQARI